MRKVLIAAVVVPLAFLVLFLLLFAGGPEIDATTTSCTVTGTATGKLSAAQVAAFAYGAGFRNTDASSPDASGDTLTIAVALTMPESGADASAVQQGQPYATTGYGLWQVTPGDSEPQCGVDDQLLDASANACAAYAKWKSQGFTAWTTFTGGEYLQWMGWAQSGVANMSTSGVTCQAAPTATSASTDAQVGSVGQVVQEATPPGLPASFEGFPWGQCTYWAALHFPVAWHGNAYQWWANAAAAGAAETQTPTVGSVVVYGQGNGYSDLGHVAYVVAVSGSTFTVSEMNYLGVGIVDERTSSMTGVLGFIV